MLPFPLMESGFAHSKLPPHLIGLPARFNMLQPRWSARCGIACRSFSDPFSKTGRPDLPLIHNGPLFRRQVSALDDFSFQLIAGVLKALTS